MRVKTEDGFSNFLGNNSSLPFLTQLQTHILVRLLSPELSRTGLSSKSRKLRSSSILDIISRKSSQSNHDGCSVKICGSRCNIPCKTSLCFRNHNIRINNLEKKRLLPYSVTLRIAYHLEMRAQGIVHALRCIWESTCGKRLPSRNSNGLWTVPGTFAFLSAHQLARE